MQRILTVSWLTLAVAVSTAAASASQLTIDKLAPTPLFPKAEPLRQVAHLSVTNASGTAIDAEVRVNAGDGAESTQDVRLEPGGSTVTLLVPDIQQPATLRVELVARADGRVLARHEQAWQPQRKWKVYIVHSSHEDIGYENYIYEKQHEVADFIDLGRHLSGEPGRQRAYHYTLETLLFQSNYIDERSEAAWRRVVEEDIRTGKISLMGAPSGVHTQWLDYEPLARMNYPGRRETKDRFDLDLDTFLLVDNPSMSWSAAQAVANAGFRYLVRFGQPWRTGGNNSYATTQVPALFWWQGPDGDTRILYSWRSHYGLSFWYGQPGGGGGHRELLPLAEDNVTRELRAIESGELLGPYPYDAVIVPSYSDHTIPSFDARALRNWQQEYAYPEIHVASPTTFMAYIEEHFGDQVPVLSGELNNFSADYAAIDPDGHGRIRRAACLLPLAEGIGSIAGAMDPAFATPDALIYRSFLHMFDYVEHSWPTAPRVNPFHTFNAQLKTHESYRALHGAEQAYAAAADALFSRIATSEPSVVVFNPLAHPRNDVVEVTIDTKTAPAALVDATTGETVPVQADGEGKLIFIAKDVPAFGYKTYRFAERPPDDAASTNLAAGEHELSNAFYTIRFDPNTGGVVSIHDKELDRELVDTSREQFNQLIRYTVSAREADDGVRSSPSGKVSLASDSGPVRAQLTVTIADDAVTGAAITQTVILYRDLKRIDVVNSLRSVDLMHSLNHGDRYKENIFYAFPFKMDRFEARAEYPGGVVRPHADQMRWGSHDYLYANRWVDLNDGEAGVTLAPGNAATISFGDIRYNKLAIDYEPTTPSLYSYALSNRMAGLLSRNANDCDATLRYAFTSYAGKWDSGAATRFGWSVASPMTAQVRRGSQSGTLPESESFLAIDAPNVQLVTLKPSTQPGRGWVFRLAETDGKGGEVTVRLPHLPINAAVATDLVENDGETLPVSDRAVTLSVRPFSMTTVRVFADERAPAAVTGLRAASITDKSLVLHWDALDGAAGYNVYRSEDPDAPATAWTLVGRTAGNSFADDWLKLQTPYHYHVAAVTTANTQGDVSQPFTVTTSGDNASPPSPVRDLGVILQGPDRIDLYWRRNPEPDVARYRVYRAPASETDPAKAQEIGTVEQTSRFLQVFQDADLPTGESCRYWVFPEDWAGHVQRASPSTVLQMYRP